MRRFLTVFIVATMLLVGFVTQIRAQESVVHMLYFYSTDCDHCQVTLEEVLNPLEAEYGDQLDLRLVEIGSPSNYELLIQAEEYFGVPSEQRAIPTLVIGEKILIGEDAIRQQLPGLIEQGLAQGGVDWPDIPGFDPSDLSAPSEGTPLDLSLAEDCEDESADTCGSAKPVWGAYFYQTGCKECSRAESDIQYMRSRYPQFVVQEFNVYDNAALAEWLAERAGREGWHSPSLFIGQDALVGEEEITPENIEALIERHAESGSGKVWEAFDPQKDKSGLVERFRSLGPLTVVLAGLVDGLNPCAFATLIFFVSYLSLSGRQGKEILAVGGAFTLGVFLAYLGVGLGLYQVLDALGGLLDTLSRWLYGLMGLMCAVLAVYSFLDFLKARRGEIGDMSLNLPHSLRMRINSVIRQGRKSQAYVVGALVTGIVVSFLELACTGQVYLPTIIFVTSVPDLRAKAVVYLFLYNLLFVMPLVVVFVLAYYGTTSKDLTRFMQKRAAMVKLGMVVLFASLSTLLFASIT